MIITAPDRTLAQRQAALKRANAVRTRNARIKEDLAQALLSPADVLANPETGSMKVIDLLLRTPRIGRVNAERMLKAARISPTRRLAGLTERQRGDLLMRIGANRAVRLAYEAAARSGEVSAHGR